MPDNLELGWEVCLLRAPCGLVWARAGMTCEDVHADCLLYLTRQCVALHRVERLLNMVDSQLMDAESDIEVARRLVTTLSQFLEDTHNKETLPDTPKSLQQSASDLDPVAVQVIRLLGAKQGRASVIEAVMESDKAGETLLHFSASLGFKNLLRELLMHGVDCDMRDANGFTPLHFAARFGYIDCVKLLIFEGADSTIVDIRGHTARDVAIQSNCFDVAQFLKAREAIATDIDKLTTEESRDKHHKVMGGVTGPCGVVACGSPTSINPNEHVACE